MSDGGVRPSSSRIVGATALRMPSDRSSARRSGSASDATKTTGTGFVVWAVIGPFNYPNALIGGPTGAALVAGNTVIAKPSEIGSYSCHLVGRALTDAGVPRGVFNIVTGGAEVGSALVHHSGVDGVTFTGSSAVGMSILSSFSASYPKPAICEMGGKNPIVVLNYADVDLAVDATIQGAFGSTGQRCTATSRAVLQDGIADEFVEKLLARAKAIKLGDGMSQDTDMGPIVDEEQMKSVSDGVEQAK